MKEERDTIPSKATVQFLSWFCPDHIYEEIEGDLIQKFNRDIRTVGEKRAKRKLIWNTVCFFRPEIILRNTFSYSLINTIMLRNYFTIAFRNVLKNKVFSAINIFGLGIGLAACLLIFQFVSFELSYDTFSEKLDRTYRVTNDRFQNGKLIQHGTIMYPTIGPTMAKDYPEIEMYTRLMPGGDLNIKVDEKIFKGENSHFVDEHFLSVFSFPMLAGERLTALKDRYTMVITERTAIKYFGVPDKNYSSVLGKEVYWGLDTQPYKITGVCTNVPENSHLQFDGLVSYSTLIYPQDHGADDSWTWSDMYHYLVLKPGVDYKTLEAKFPEFSQRYFQGDKVSGSVEKFYLQPMKNTHLYSDYEYDFAKTASGKAVWAMVIVAVFVLLIAWINYINLTTSRALDRAKEVGLRKVMGALRSQLIKQFLFESILISLFAFVIALAIVMLSQSSFNEMINGNLSWWKVLSEMNASTTMILVSVMITGVLLSGFYPAFVLSSYHPVTVLKGKFQRSSRGQFLRKSLVVFQFTSSAALITGTLVVSKQLRFMNEADLGVNIHNTLIVQAPERTAWDSTFIQRVESYKHELTQIKGVVSATTSWRLPGDRLGRSFGIRLSDQPSDAHFTMSHQGVDHNFFDTYDIAILAGRKFLPTDHRIDFDKIEAVILNLNAIKLLGIDSPQNAIGKQIIWGDSKTKITIVGVVNNFHQQSLKNPMEPMIFAPAYSTNSSTSIKLDNTYKDKPQKIIADVREAFLKFFPDNAFEYTFLEDRFKHQYNDDNRFGKVISVFTLLAIIISCLGLVGLSSYMAIQRTKEIGIRKVLGASLFSIVTLLSSGFIKLVLLATLLALPIAYIAAENWLEGYAYKISPGVLIFALPVILILLIASFTMSFQVLRTARTNPADTLKYE
ncbi:MAG: ABC transporter permease [Chryseolinea sp.]